MWDRRYWLQLAQTYTWPSLALHSHLSLLQMPATLRWRTSDTKVQVNTIPEVHLCIEFRLSYQRCLFLRSGGFPRLSISPDFPHNPCLGAVQVLPREASLVGFLCFTTAVCFSAVERL